MHWKSLIWRLILASLIITLVIFVGAYSAGFVSSQSAELIVYIPLVGVVNGEEEPPGEPTPTPTSEPPGEPTPTATPKPPDSPPEKNVFYISPSGNDASDGTTESKAWATFDRAWIDLFPGDTLIMLDGVYNQSLRPDKRGGEPGNPITIRAKNDGQAIIDGQHQRTPIFLSKAIGNYYVLEGIVARRGDLYVYRIEGDHNVLLRVSGYDADIDTNSNVISFGYGADHNLLEDCVAAGSGRKTISIFEGAHNTIRRCFANWQEWDGREFCTHWPNGQSIQVYHGKNNIIENSIAYGPVPTWSISVQANSRTSDAIGNKVLGSIAIFAGVNPDGTFKEWGDTRPQPTSCDQMLNMSGRDRRSGFRLFGSGNVRDNLFQDNLAWGNASIGIASNISENMYSNNQIIRATMVNNGLDNPEKYGGIGTDVVQSELAGFDSVTESYIETIYTGGSNYSTMNGEGARLTHRYVDGVLTDDPLWPWPMEDRIQAELGISVTDLISGILSKLP